MNILILTGLGEPHYCSNDSLIQGLRKLGHRVLACGPRYHFGPSSLELGDDFFFLEDKTFPEYYQFEDFWDKATELIDNEHFDFILQIEPHFYLTGPKPSDAPPIAYYCIDIHCGGEWYHRYIKAHEYLFDFILLGQPQFSYYFNDIKIPTYPMPLALDEDDVLELLA